MLLLCALIAGSGSTWADSWTWTASTVNDLGSTSTSSGSSATVTLNGKSWTVVRTLISGSSYTGTSLSSGCIQLGKNGGVDNVSMKTSAFDGNIIKKVSVECSSYNNAHKCSIKVGDVVYKSATATSKWTTIGTIEGTGTAQGEIDIEFTDGSRALYIKSVTVEYETASSVAKPTFSPDGGVINEATTVTISAEDGCTIYYTTNGDKPTTSSTSGTSVVIPASGTTTLKAIAVDGENNESAVATAVYTYKDPNDLSETKDKFTNTSGTLESIISYEAFKGGAGTNPGNYNNAIRLYQKSGSYQYGGYITLTAPEGYKIVGFTITTTATYTTTVDYTVDGSTEVGTGESLEASSDYSKSGLFNSSVSIFNLGSGSSGRLEIVTITVNYVRVATITLASACTDGEGNYYGTYSNASAFKVPSDLVVSEIKVVDGKLSLSNYSTDDIVPANTGVMVASDEEGEHIIVLTSGGTSKLGSDNMLKASSVDMTGSNKFYRLTMHNGDTIGFWWGAENGAAFTIAANKAYLAVPEALAREGFAFDFGDATNIRSIGNEQLNNDNVYNLAGQRVAQPTKGLYIVNGKKIVIR